MIPSGANKRLTRNLKKEKGNEIFIEGFESPKIPENLGAVHMQDCAYPQE